MIKDKVDIIIVHYNAIEILPNFFQSLSEINYPDYKIYFYDNASIDGSADWVEHNYPDINVFRSDVNHFFCKSNNYAVAQGEGEFILLINNDIIVEPDFIHHMVTRIKKDELIAAVASKMLLSRHPGFLDSTGTILSKEGHAYNRGIGQPDLGQFDGSTEVFGACFGCTLLRRSMWEEKVGGLDPDYFGYYDDTDWCYRANLMGYKIVYEPQAVVYHDHSTTSRKNGTQENFKGSLKYYLIYRNLLWTVQKNTEPLRALYLTLNIYFTISKVLIKPGSYNGFKNAIRLLITNLISLPKTISKRVKIQRSRKISDSEILSPIYGNRTFFNGDSYEPDFSLDNLEYTFELAGREYPDSSYSQLVQEIKKVKSSITKVPESANIERSKLFDKLKKYVSDKVLEEFRLRNKP